MKRKQVRPVIEVDCLGWCNKKILSKDAGDRYCRKCRERKKQIGDQLTIRCYAYYSPEESLKCVLP